MADGLRHARWKPPTAEWGVLPAEGHLPYALTVPGSHWSTPRDPGGAPYGRTESVWTVPTDAQLFYCRREKVNIYPFFFFFIYLFFILFPPSLF